MKEITAQLTALFATGQYNYAQLFQFNLVGGGSLYYSGGDIDIYLNSADSGGNAFWADQYYSAGGSIGPYCDRKDNKAKMHVAIGLQVDTLVFDVVPGQALINGASFLTAIREGIFDGAEVLYLGAYWPVNTAGYVSPVVPTGTILKYLGRVGNVDASRNLATFTINSYLELLNQNMPINLYQTTCVNSLYDGSCTLNSANFTTSSAAMTGSTVNLINATLSQETGYFSLGTITFTSGANNGISRTIKLHTQSVPSTMTLVSPLPSAPANGDTFTVIPGCDKMQPTCAAKFNNLINFRGFPYIPEMETAS